MRSDRWTAFFIFLLFSAIYLAFSGDRFDDFQASDEAIMFQTTVALVERGSLRPRLDERYAGQEAKYGLGQSLAAVPLYLVARSLFAHLPEGVSPAAVALPLACATNALICAAVAAAFFLLARKLGYGARTAAAGALVAGLATVVAPYSKSFFSEPLVALCLLLALGAIAKPAGEVPPSARDWFRAGAWLGLAVITRMDNATLVPVFLAGLWLGGARARWREGLKASALFLVPLAAAAAFILWTNLLRSGSLGGGGYAGEGFSTLVGVGLFGLLFSPSHGVFWFSPPLAVALFYLPKFHRRNARLCFIAFASAAVKLFLFAKWWNWFGGWSWGSRFLLPLVPAALLPLLEPISRWGGLRRTEKALIAGACAAGLLVQICGLLVAPNAYHGNIQFLAGAGSGRIQPIADREQLLVFSPTQSPLFGSWPIIASGRLDWFGLRFGRYFPQGLLWAIFASLAAAFAAGLAGIASRWVAEKSGVIGGGAESAGATGPPADESNGETRADFAPSRGTLRLAAALAFANIVFFAFMAVAIRGNGLWRTERLQYSDGLNRAEMKRAASVYLDDEISLPPGTLSSETEWMGYIEIPTTGQYSFYTVALGSFEFEMAGRTVLENSLTGGRRSQRADLRLKQGFYPLRLAYKPVVPGGDSATSGTAAAVARRRVRRIMQLYWTIPGGGEYENIVGRAWFYPRPPGRWKRLLAKTYRLKIGFVLVSLLILWWAWVNGSLRRAAPEGSRGQDPVRTA